MTTRTATCSCGQLKVTCDGDPIRISVCHCYACQQRTGSAFGVQARFPLDRVKVEGTTAKYARTGDSGTTATFQFCPSCGSTVLWTNAGMDSVAVAVGAFADSSFPPPRVTVYEARQHAWARLPGDDLERYD